VGAGHINVKSEGGFNSNEMVTQSSFTQMQTKLVHKPFFSLLLQNIQAVAGAWRGTALFFQKIKVVQLRSIDSDASLWQVFNFIALSRVKFYDVRTSGNCN